MCVNVCLQFCILNCTQATLTRQLNEWNVPNEWNGFMNSPIDIFSPHNNSFEFNCSEKQKPWKNVQFYTVLGNELRVGCFACYSIFVCVCVCTVTYCESNCDIVGGCGFDDAVIFTIFPFSTFLCDNIIWKRCIYAGKKSTIHNYLCIQNDVYTI